MACFIKKLRHGEKKLALPQGISSVSSFLLSIWPPVTQLITLEESCWAFTLWGSVCCLVNCIYLHLRPCWAGGALTEEEKGINKVGSAQLLDSSQSDGETGPLSSHPCFSSSSSAARVIFKNCFKRQTRFLLSPSAPHSEFLPPVAAFWLLRGAIQHLTSGPC